MKPPEYYQSKIPPIDRPDGREVTSEIARLRAGTRALRLHLDTLPVDYNEGVSADKFLAGISFNFARQRYGCAESLIGAGIGGVVLGGLSRSILVDGLRWRWIAQDPVTRRRTILGDLREERGRIYETARRNGINLLDLDQWLLPIAPVADLAGRSRAWEDAPMSPTDDALLSDYLASVSDPPATSSGSDPMRLLDASGVRGAALVLSFAGHGNFLGLQSCLSEDGQPGQDLRDVYEALFMHASAVGVVTVLSGTAATVPDLWPWDVAKAPFLDEAARLAREVAAAARPIHRLFASREGKHVGKRALARTKCPTQTLVLGANAAPHPASADDIKATIRAVDSYWEYSRRGPLADQLVAEEITLHEVLNMGGAYSNLDAAVSTFDKDGSAPIAVFAARMLLEEAARLAWRFNVKESDFKERATQYFDEFRAHRNKTLKVLVGNGVARLDAERFFELPRHILAPPPKPPTKNRKPIPSVASLIRDFGAATMLRDPGWLEVAYSLLSQFTHATALGALHTVRRGGNGWVINEVSPQLLGLSLDIVCFASAYLIGHSSLILTEISPQAIEFRAGLGAKAAEVHEAARRVHGLG